MSADNHAYGTPPRPDICQSCNHDRHTSAADALACPCQCHDIYRRFGPHTTRPADGPSLRRVK